MLDALLHRGRASLKNTATAQHKGYDTGRKVSGIKHHIAVDTQGSPHAIAVTTADVNDRNWALLMLLLSSVALVLRAHGAIGVKNAILPLMPLESDCSLRPAASKALLRDFVLAAYKEQIFAGFHLP